MSYRIFITGSGLAEEAIKLLQRENCIYEIGKPADTPVDIIQKLKLFRPDALIVRQGIISAEVQKSAPNLKVISKHGVGTDKIDIPFATQMGIAVMYTPNSNFESVAEHTLALLLSLLRKIPQKHNEICAGQFDKTHYDGLELTNKTIGLVGFGKIGQRFAELLSPFNMSIIAYRPSQRITSVEPSVTYAKTVEELFRASDIISLHCPVTDKTFDLINKKSILRMRHGAYLINTARGELINENDLFEALKTGQISGAALDVFQNEPLLKKHPLFELQNVIGTPHLAGMSDNSMKNMGIESVQNALSVLKGQPPKLKCLKNIELLNKD